MPYRAATVCVVVELTEHPGAEESTKSWQRAIDIGVWVSLKCLGSSALSSPMWRFSSAMMPTAARGDGCFEPASAWSRSDRDAFRSRCAPIDVPVPEGAGCGWRDLAGGGQTVYRHDVGSTQKLACR